MKRRPRGHPIGGGGGIRQRRHARGCRRQSIRHNNTAPDNLTGGQNRGGRPSDKEVARNKTGNGNAYSRGEGFASEA